MPESLPQKPPKSHISRQAQSLLGVPYCSCDLFWPNHHVAIEYDSRQFHGCYDAQLSDAQRKVMLENEGIAMIPVHFEQVVSDAAFAAIALRLHTLLDKRYRCCPEKHAEARAKLRAEIRDALAAPSFY